MTKLSNAIRRNLKQPYEFICVSENPKAQFDGARTIPLLDHGLLSVPGCVVRMRMFDPAWQASVQAYDRIVNLDLDLVVTGGLDTLLDRPDPFTILQGINTTNPCQYNGSMFMLRAGYRPDVWSDFSVEANSKVPFHAFPDDQGWMHHKMPDAGAWGPSDGVYGFKKKGWPQGINLPANARVVAFPGWRDPSMSMFKSIGWIEKHWK